MDNKNASRIYNRRAAYFITVQFLLLPVQKSKPISQRRSICGPNLYRHHPIEQYSLTSTYAAYRIDMYRHSYRYTTNALRVLCNFLISQLSYALTLSQTPAHTYCAIFSGIFATISFCAHFTHDFIYICSAYVVFFFGSAFFFLFVFCLCVLHSTGLISFNKNELNLSCKESYWGWRIHELIDNRLGIRLGEEDCGKSTREGAPMSAYDFVMTKFIYIHTIYINSYMKAINYVRMYVLKLKIIVWFSCMNTPKNSFLGLFSFNCTYFAFIHDYYFSHNVCIWLRLFCIFVQPACACNRRKEAWQTS